MESLCWHTVGTCGLSNFDFVISGGHLADFGTRALVDERHENTGNKAKTLPAHFFPVMFDQHAWDENHLVSKGEASFQTWQTTLTSAKIQNNPEGQIAVYRLCCCLDLHKPAANRGESIETLAKQGNTVRGWISCFDCVYFHGSWWQKRGFIVSALNFNKSVMCMCCCLGRSSNRCKQNKLDGNRQHLSWCSFHTLFHLVWSAMRFFFYVSVLLPLFVDENVAGQHLSVYLKTFFLKNEPTVNLSCGSSVSQLPLWPRPPLFSEPHVGTRTAASPPLGLSLSSCDIIELLAAAHVSSSSQ